MLKALRTKYRGRWREPGLAAARDGGLGGRNGQKGTGVRTIAAIALGAAVGANLRYGVSLWAARQWGTAFPYGTLLINLSGSFAIGIVMVLLSARLVNSDAWRLLLVTGLLGGFTTFSSFSYENYTLLISGDWLAAGLNILASVGLGLFGVFLGARLAQLVV
jgi:fluoride exporter